MTYAGLRIGQFCSLRRRDVDLATGWLTVTESKTDAGTRQYEAKVRTATLGSAVKQANGSVTGRGLPPPPDGLTRHSLRLGEGERERLRARVEGVQLAVIGIRGENADMETAERQVA